MIKSILEEAYAYLHGLGWLLRKPLSFVICFQWGIVDLVCPWKIQLLTLQWMVGAARTQAPSATNNDAGSPTWGDLKLSAPPQSAMEVTSLGHSSSWSWVDPVQVSDLIVHSTSLLILSITVLLSSCKRCGTIHTLAASLKRQNGFGYYCNHGLHATGPFKWIGSKPKNI